MKPSMLHVPALTISASPRDTQENPLSSSPAWEARTSGTRSVASLQPCRMGATVNGPGSTLATRGGHSAPSLDRKSTRLNSSHTVISYAVFCLKKKKKEKKLQQEK